MRPYGVIESLDVVENGCLSGAARDQILKIDAFAFQTGEKVLGHGIVVRVTLARHALPDVVSLQRGTISGRCVLEAAIGVEDQAWFRFLPPHRHVKGIESELRIDPVPHGITDHFFQTQILDDGKIQPALASGDVGDVAHPGHVGFLEFEMTLKQIGRDGVSMVGVGCLPIGSLTGGMDIRLFHQPPDALAGARPLCLNHMIEAV